jgi:DNA-binding MarR family transcriptional regulator
MATRARAGTSLDEGSTDLMHRLLKLTNRLMAPFTTHLATRHRISLNEFRLLMTLGRYGDRASHELAAHTGVNAMSVSRAVAALERHGRIRVAVDPENRRRKRLSLTAEGHALYELMRPESDRVADYLLSRLSAGDLSALDRIVDTLIATLEETDSEGRSLFIERTRPDREEEV